MKKLGRKINNRFLLISLQVQQIIKLDKAKQLKLKGQKSKQNKQIMSKTQTKPSVVQNEVMQPRQQSFLGGQQNRVTQQMDQVLGQNQLIDYFRSVNISSVAEKKADFYTYQMFINVTEKIYNDELWISEHSQNINPLLARQKITEEEQKANELKIKKQEILMQLAMLDDQVSRRKRNQHSMSKGKMEVGKNLSMDSSRVSGGKDNQEDGDEHRVGKLVLSKEEHKQLMGKIVKEREERERKRLELKQKEEQRLKKISEEERALELKRLEEEKKKKVEEIEENLKKKREMHEKHLQQQKQSTKKVKQLKNKRFLHEQIAERFQMNIKMPLLQQQKKILKQKRQFAKAYSIDEIKSHERAYMELRQNSMKKSMVHKDAVNKSLNESALNLPKKSFRLEKILQEEKLEQRQKLMEKKRAVEEKLQRQENYIEYLKENFSSKVKVDKSKEDEIKKRIEKSIVKREDVDLKSIGMNYLMQAKKKRRKTTQIQDGSKDTNEHQANITVLSEQNQKKAHSAKLEESRLQNLMKKRQQKIQILINDTNLNEAQRIKKLKMETERINEAFRMKQEILKYGYSEKVEDEAVQLLLTSIQAKMGIIDITKEK